MKNLFFILSVVFTVGCSQLQTRRDGPTDTQAPYPADAPVSSPSAPAPLNPQNPKKVILVLGGGGARTLAHAGVIRALVKEKIEISFVAGMEWSSLVAASFAVSGQVHDMDWKLYKLDALNLKFGSGYFGLGGKKSIEDLSEYFSANFGRGNMESAKIRFSCASTALGGAHARILARGSLAESLKQCIPFPPFFEVGKYAASMGAAWGLIKAAKATPDEVVVFVDVLGASVLSDPLIRKDKATTLLWTQALELNQISKGLVKNAFTVPLDKYSVFDFSNRKKIEEEGERAGAEIARRLKEQYPL